MKNYEREGKVEMCPRFQSKERGGRHGNILPTNPLRNGKLTSLVAIELLPPGLQVVRFCGSWLLLKSREHKTSTTSRQLPQMMKQEY